MALTYQGVDLSNPAFGGGSTPPYVESFDNTTSWTLSGSDYIITVLASAHEKGINPQVQVFEDIGGGIFEEVVVTVSINTSGDVTIKVDQTPEMRFQGKLNIIGE